MKVYCIPLSILFLVGCTTTGQKKAEIPPNPDHFGCWKHVTTEVEGINNTLRLCITYDMVHFDIYYPNDTENPYDDTICKSKAAVAGYGENGTRAYYIEEGICSNGRTSTRGLYSCDLKGSDILECLSGTLTPVGEEVQFEEKNRFEFVRE